MEIIIAALFCLTIWNIMLTALVFVLIGFAKETIKVLEKMNDH